MDSPAKKPYFKRMPKINLDHTSPLSKTEAFEKLKTLFEQDPDLKRMDSSYVCKFDQANCSGSAKGSKFSASMKIKDSGSASQVSLDIEIPFLLSPFKGMIQETLQKKLKKALG